MTIQEFSDAFDTLLNSYSTQAAFGEGVSKTDIALDEYEKSLYLTKAQEEVVLELYNGKNLSGESFEQTEELRRYLSSLISEAKLGPITNTSGRPIGMEGKNSYFFSLPDGNNDNPTVWFITYEAVFLDTETVKCEKLSSQDVYPVTQDEYHKIKRNPFRGVNDHRALRLDLADGIVEIICKYPVKEYYIRYLKKLKPIVLINLPDDLSIYSVSEATECEIHESLHQRILEKAVRQALRDKIRTNNNENV